MSRALGVYAPAISTFPNSTDGIGTPSVHTGSSRDVYLTLVSCPTSRPRDHARRAVNPMIMWLWIGGVVMALGTILALVADAAGAGRGPRPARPAVAPRADEPEPTTSSPGGGA